MRMTSDALDIGFPSAPCSFPLSRGNDFSLNPLEIGGCTFSHVDPSRPSARKVVCPLDIS
jgi:hypothetical protein